MCPVDIKDDGEIETKEEGGEGDEGEEMEISANNLNADEEEDVYDENENDENVDEETAGDEDGTIKAAVEAGANAEEGTKKTFGGPQDSESSDGEDGILEEDDDDDLTISSTLQFRTSLLRACSACPRLPRTSITNVLVFCKVVKHAVDVESQNQSKTNTTNFVTTVLVIMLLFSCCCYY